MRSRRTRLAPRPLFHDRRHSEARAPVPNASGPAERGLWGPGEVTVLSDGAEIMKRLPKALPQPTTHIIDSFHIAMKIQPLQQIADHIVRWREAGSIEMARVDGDVQSLKWKLWHGQTDRALDQLETMTSDFAELRERGNLSATRLLHLAHPLLTYVRSNKSAIINYGAGYRLGRRVATALAESAVNSLVARRMVKKQQMQWSKRGAHLLLQFRAAVLNGDLRERLTYKPPKQVHRSRIAWMFEPTPPTQNRLAPQLT
jgi:hypothetical protein